jgi:hypothetical protein
MSPRDFGLVFGLSRALRRSRGTASARRMTSAKRQRPLAAEPLESRCMLSTTARLENNISMFDRIPVIHPLRPANLPTSFVGQFAWSGFNSFCVEIGQSISPGLHTFPTRAPLASSGLANAGLVADFWRSYGPKTTGFTSVTDAAAFQLGIWELISDGPSRNLKSGSFQVGASASPAVARAESWLNGTGTPAPSAGGPAVSLYVLQHPTRQDQVVWEPLPNITVQVAPPSVAEDGPQKLTYTFTATGPLTRDVTVNYSVGGTATAASDFTGLPAGGSTGAITIPANSSAPGSAATLTITPTPDTVIEFDETVVISLLPGTGYTFDTTRPPATGTIENDDYLVDIDVDSNNDGEIDPDNGPAGTDDRIEDRYDLPGVIVPVGGSRVKMIVDVPQGMKATLAFAQGTDSVRVYRQATAGDPVLEEGKESTQIVGSGSPQAFWIEAFAPSASIPSIAFSLTLDVATGSGSTSKPPRDLIRAQAVALDLDVDSNNNGTIDPDNGPTGTDDRIEEQSPGRIIFANTDDDDGNGVADALDAGPVESESDLARVLLTVAPDTARGNIILTYDDSIVRLYKHASRHGPIASGVATATDGFFYVEGRSAGTTLVTATYPDAASVNDTIRFSVLSYPDTIDVDIDSDNNNDFLRPARSEWEDILEDHEYGIGKLIMLDNDRRSLTPVVLEIPAGLPENDPAVGVRIDWSGMGPAGEVRLWNRERADGVRNPAPVSQGGNRIVPGARNRLAELNYNPQTGMLMLWAEGVRENAQLKTLAGVEAAPRVDERIRGTVVVNGDDAAFDEVKYVVTNEDSFYHALHTRQEVRNALAARGVYSFAPMPKFSLQPKSPLDLRRLGVPDDANLLLGEGSGIAGFKAMVYQDYITGEDQYVLAFAGTDDTFGQLLDWLLFGAEGDWKNNFDQGLGRGTPPQYEAAMNIGDGLSKSDGIPAGHLIVAGHSLGGGLATAAAVVRGFRADTFSAAWLRKETLLEPDGLGGTRERYPGSLVNFAGAVGKINAHYVDWDILTYFQTQFRQLDPTIAPVGLRHELDGPHDFNLTLADPIPLASLYYMSELHKNSSVLYGLLVTEDRLGHITIDLLGYVAYFSNNS